MRQQVVERILAKSVSECQKEKRHSSWNFVYEFRCRRWSRIFKLTVAKFCQFLYCSKVQYSPKLWKSVELFSDLCSQLIFKVCSIFETLNNIRIKKTLKLFSWKSVKKIVKVTFLVVKSSSVKKISWRYHSPISVVPFEKFVSALPA